MFAEVELLRQGAPRSIDVLLFEADIVRHRDLSTGDRDRDRMRRAMAALGDTDRLLPDTYSVLAARFDIALAASRLDEASALLDRLVLIDVDSSTPHLQRARLYRKRGELGASRGELDDDARRDSFSWRVLYDRARVFGDLGDRTATRTAIDQVLARSPDNYGGLSLFAREELDAGRPTCAEQIYDDLASAAAARSSADELLARGPRPAALYTAALVHAYLGDREIAARYATAYLDGGSSPADFAYPWFDDLRRDPSLGPRLAVRAAARTCEASPGTEGRDDHVSSTGTDANRWSQEVPGGNTSVSERRTEIGPDAYQRIRTG